MSEKPRKNHFLPSQSMLVFWNSSMCVVLEFALNRCGKMAAG
jgi:hypothetical protein